MNSRTEASYYNIAKSASAGYGLRVASRGSTAMIGPGPGGGRRSAERLFIAKTEIRGQNAGTPEARTTETRVLNQPYPCVLLHEHDDGPRVRRRLGIVQRLGDALHQLIGKVGDVLP